MQEIEIRGVISIEQCNHLKDYLEKNATFEKNFKRLSVEISPGFDPLTKKWNQEQLNFRIKKSDNEEKISLKVGDSFGEKVKEYELFLESGQVLTALELFAHLGYGTGMVYFWESWVYTYEGFEIKLSKYPNDYVMWEIEARGELTDEESLRKAYALAEELKLKALNRDELAKEIDYQCQNIFETYSLDLVKEKLQLFQ